MNRLPARHAGPRKYDNKPYFKLPEGSARSRGRNLVERARLFAPPTTGPPACRAAA